MVTSDRSSEEQGEFQEKVVNIRRVAKVVKGGRNLTFNAMVVVGDGQGSVGAGLGKGKAVPDAIRKGAAIARKEMTPVALNGSTIPYAVRTKFGASRVLLRPAQPGIGHQGRWGRPRGDGGARRQRRRGQGAGQPQSHQRGESDHAGTSAVAYGGLPRRATACNASARG